MHLHRLTGTGAAGGDRTHDPWLRRPILYPLSYSRFECLCKATAQVSFAAAMLVVPGVRLRFSQQNPSCSLRFPEAFMAKRAKTARYFYLTPYAYSIREGLADARLVII
jgi:hypothetical protein